MDEKKTITVDLAGAMEKITPEMMDAARDAMIEAMAKSGKRMMDGLSVVIDMCDEGKPHAEISAVARDALPK